MIKASINLQTPMSSTLIFIICFPGSLVIAGILLCFLCAVNVVCGLIVYAYFADCDPYLSNKIDRIDQIVPYFLIKISKGAPGLSGLFMAALVSASISTLSSSLNSIASVVYKDFVKQIIKKELSEQTSLVILKTIVVVQGLMSFLLTLIIPYFGDIIPLAIGLTGLLDGPSVGLIILAVLFPSANATGAFYGALCGVATIGVLYFPALYYKFQKLLIYPGKPLSIEGCEAINGTLLNSTILNSRETPQPPEPYFLFRISYNYYALIGALATVIFGLVISNVIKKKEISRNQNEENTSEPLLYIKNYKPVNLDKNTS